MKCLCRSSRNDDRQASILVPPRTDQFGLQPLGSEQHGGHGGAALLTRIPKSVGATVDPTPPLPAGAAAVASSTVQSPDLVLLGTVPVGRLAKWPSLPFCVASCRTIWRPRAILA